MFNLSGVADCSWALSAASLGLYRGVAIPKMVKTLRALCSRSLEAVFVCEDFIKNISEVRFKSCRVLTAAPPLEG